MKAIKMILLITLLSCSTIRTYERKAINTGNQELYRQVDAYFETIDNRENNRVGEQDSIMKLIERREK